MTPRSDTLLSDSGLDALILCGGLGTRLQSVVPGKQKVVAEVGNRPFLGILLDTIFSQGIKRAVLCVGHHKEQVMEYAEKERAVNPAWGEIVFSEEDAPLGTGGAIKNAESKVTGKDFFVMNGDTLADVSLQEMYEFHVRHKSVLTIAAAPVPDRADVGSIDREADGSIMGFRERAETRAGLINAGTYIMTRDIFGAMPKVPFSLETNFFPKIVATNSCYAFVAGADVLDIGTPERYTTANKRFAV
jgi:NDP-sugar pyrophosphorylase family protein